MNLFGIDIGSDSVRVSFCDSKTGACVDLERPLERTKNENRHTMSGPALWANIVLMLVEHDERFSELYGKPEIGGFPVKIPYSTNTNPTESSGPKLELESKVGGPISLAAEPSGNATFSTSLQTLPHSAICVAATCSMVVMKRISDGRKESPYFVPIEPGHEVIVWMDTRAQHEAAWVGARLPALALAQIGGTVTPEMGIAKLKWVDTHLQKPHPESEIVVFELYDWISYVALAGGYDTNGHVQCLQRSDILLFAPGLRAMDGSVKGWGADILQDLQISVGVGITPNFENPDVFFPIVGTPLGQIGPVIVGHGCIDCYAGWAGQAARDASVRASVRASPSGPGNENEESGNNYENGQENSSNSDSKTFPGNENEARVFTNNGPEISLNNGLNSGPENSPAQCSLLMVAGTSTCFIAATASKCACPVPGLWGPFGQLGAAPVYSFGQPATGQLFTELFAEHATKIGSKPPFAFVEKESRHLEKKTGILLPVLCRHYLYYGDKHGNRSPYGDFRMGEIFADGANARNEDTFGFLLAKKINTQAKENENENHKNLSGVEELVLKYYLTLEFLALQTRLLGCKLASAAGPVRNLYIAGSQAQNARLVAILAHLAFPNATIYVRDGSENKYAGSRGIALAMAPFFISRGGVDIFEDTWRPAKVEPLDPRAVRVLQAKARAFDELAQWQHRFHDAMGAL